MVGVDTGHNVKTELKEKLAYDVSNIYWRYPGSREIAGKWTSYSGLPERRKILAKGFV